MTTYTFSKVDGADLEDRKQIYLNQLAAPLDGMWHAFVDLADHYSIADGGETIGYCVVNSEQKLLQFYVPGAHDPSPIFSRMIADLNVTGAVLNTAEFQCLSLCMDHQKSVEVNALMYHLENNAVTEDAAFPPETEFRLVEASGLATAIEFGVNTLGADPDWLKGYMSGLIKRAELFGLWRDGGLIATGELRVSDSQKPYADLGMIVSKAHRKQGLATLILRHMVHLCRARGLSAICSTARDNIGAQKAIANAGFVSHHRILEFTF